MSKRKNKKYEEKFLKLITFVLPPVIPIYIILNLYIIYLINKIHQNDNTKNE